MIKRCVAWQLAHPVANQVVNALVLGALTALVWVTVGRSAGIVFAFIWAVLVISGAVLLLARFIILRCRSAH